MDDDAKTIRDRDRYAQQHSRLLRGIRKVVIGYTGIFVSRSEIIRALACPAQLASCPPAFAILHDAFDMEGVLKLQQDEDMQAPRAIRFPELPKGRAAFYFIRQRNMGEVYEIYLILAFARRSSLNTFFRHTTKWYDFGVSLTWLDNGREGYHSRSRTSIKHPRQRDVTWMHHAIQDSWSQVEQEMREKLDALGLPNPLCHLSMKEDAASSYTKDFVKECVGV